MAVRSRYVEDRLAEAVELGVSEYVVSRARISVPPPGTSLASAPLAEHDATGYNFTRGSRDEG